MMTWLAKLVVPFQFKIGYIQQEILYRLVTSIDTLVLSLLSTVCNQTWKLTA